MLRKSITCMALAATVLPLSAQDGDPRLRVSGFGTLGLAASTTDQADYVREPTQPKGVHKELDPRLDSMRGPKKSTGGRAQR